MQFHRAIDKRLKLSRESLGTECFSDIRFLFEVLTEWALFLNNDHFWQVLKWFGVEIETPKKFFVGLFSEGTVKYKHSLNQSSFNHAYMFRVSGEKVLL